MTTTAAKPEFNPWPWSLVAFFAVFISAVIGFGIFAVRQNNDLVQPDYYEQEVRFQQQIDRVQRTQALDHEVTVAFEPIARQVRLALPAAHAAKQPTGKIHFYRPSEARLDFEVPVQLDAAGKQTVPGTSLREGLWKARVTWSVDGQEFYHDETLVVPSAAP
jgi:nitrogen fixation protein FixH